MKYLFLFSTFFLCIFSAYSASVSDSLLQVLDKELKLEDLYTSQKRERIHTFQEQLGRAGNRNPATQYGLYAKLYEEYKSFNYDSAFYYVTQLQNLAYTLQDPARISEAKIKLGFILLSSGLFKETFDSLETVNSRLLSTQVKQDFFTLMARVYYDLADFNKDSHFTQLYNQKGNRYIDSTLAVSAPDSYNSLYSQVLRHARTSHIQEGLVLLGKLNKIKGLSYHQLAVVSSTLSDLYLRLGENQKAIPLLTKAAIYDIKSSTKETAAILTLANILHDQGDLTRAYSYTRKALDDANFYGARHRKIQVGSILPIIEEEKLTTVESHKRALIIYSIVATFLTLCIVFFIFFTLRQLKKLRLAKKEIDAAHTVLQATNQQLQEANSKLLEANKIKEEYIGYYFNINSEYIEKIEKVKRAIDQSLTAKKYDQLKYIVHNINMAKEREELFLSFDKVFIKLFPNFIPEFNSFFKPEDQLKLSENQPLTTDIRIFALIRLGIHENDKIAKILGYSVNTIYAYKTRIKNKSIIPNEEFEKKMMAIKPV